MAHILARLRNVDIETIGAVLKADAAQHAEQGLFLEHLWQNEDDVNEVLFLFRTDNLRSARQYVEGLHAQARHKQPDANLPQMTYLAGK